METVASIPLIWAQAVPPPPAASAALLALRRWCASMTLSSPDLVPRPLGLWIWLAGLAALFVVVVIAQGPARALRQVLDFPGHVRLASRSLGRLKRASRLVAVVCGLTVLSWTANQTVSFSNPQGLEDAEILLKTKSLGEVGFEQGVLVALTPLRDLFGMGDLVLLLVLAAALVFRHSADRWGGVPGPYGDPNASSAGWTTLIWGGAWLYALYRFAAMVDLGDLPLGGCLFVEAGIIPILMALSDGLLVAWILVELRNSGLGAGGEPLDLPSILALVPGSIIACVLALPARYLGTGALLAFLHVPSYANGVPLYAYERLGWLLVAAQGCALLTMGFAGAVAWSRRGWSSAIRGYRRILVAEGGHLLATIGLGGLSAGGLAGLAYAAVLALPRQPWVLQAADAYAHYVTLPVGLAMLAALVELGERSLPMARLAQAPASSVSGATAAAAKG